MDAKIQPDRAKLLTYEQSRVVVFGTLLPVFMGSLDGTILASALPIIGREFGDVHNLPWLITAYLIASTAITPLYGKISDIHGRRFTLRIAISLYMAGSLVCALAPNIWILILGRGLHGLGGGGLSAMAMVILGDLAAPKDRGRYYGYFSFTYMGAGAFGPLLGGFFAEYLHWSVIFWFNIAMGIAASTITVSLLRHLPRYERSHRLDFIGAGLIMAASSLFMLALNLGGVRLPWTSLPIMSLFAVALVIGALFVHRLITAPEPLIPLAMLMDPVARLTILANTFGWGPIIGLNIFLPMYLQSVAGQSATAAGLSLMVFMAALNTSAGISGHFFGRIRHYKIIPALGLAVSIASVLLLALFADRLTPWTFGVLLFFIGLGFGPTPPATAVMLQNTVVPHQFGIAVGTMNFSRNLFATMLVAIFGAIVFAGLSASTSGALADGSAEGYRRVFFVAAASLAVSFLCTILVEEKPLQTDQPGAA
jgi:MFS family permease